MMRKQRNTSYLILIAVFAAVLMPNRSFAFFPKRVFQVNGYTVPAGLLGYESHESITEDALYAIERDYYKILRTSSLPEALVIAKEQIVEANAEVDKNQVLSAWHFDGENFEEGQQSVLDRRTRIIQAVKAGSGIQARVYLGQAFHAIQDFYSHSTWVELGNRLPNPSLGVPGRSLGNVAPPTLPTCIASDLQTFYITSGYYASEGPGNTILSEDRVPLVDGKCRHGGIVPYLGIVLDLSPGAGGINKDCKNTTASPHGEMHSTAADLARMATDKFLREILHDLTPNEIDLLLGRFAIRVTNNNLSSPVTVSVAIDPFAVPFGIALKPDIYKSINLGTRMSAYIDLPPDFSGGSHSLVFRGESSESKTGLIGYTIDLPTGLSFSGNVESDTRGPITASGSTQGDLLVLKPVGGPPHRYNIYNLIANGSGATKTRFPLVVRDFLSERHRKLSFGTSVDYPNLLSGKAHVLISQLTSASDSKPLVFPVESSIESLEILVTSADSILSSNSVTLRAPSGVIPADPTGAAIYLTVTTSRVSYIIPKPEPGQWEITSHGITNGLVDVAAKSSISFDRFDSLIAGGRSGHGAFFLQPGNPVAGRTNWLRATLSGSYYSADFEIRTLTNSLLQKLGLSQTNDDSGADFSGSAALPNTPMVAYVIGRTASGTAYQRAFPSFLETGTLEITGPSTSDVAIGGEGTVTFNARNYGASERFRISVADRNGWPLTVLPEIVMLPSSGESSITVSFAVPSDTLLGSSDVLTISAQGIERPDARNFATTRLGTSAALPRLAIRYDSTGVIISWIGQGTLQSSESVNGIWLDANNNSPVSINPNSTLQFFRLRR